MKDRKIYLEALLREAVKILREQDPTAPATAAGSAVPPSPVPPATTTNAVPSTPAAGSPLGDTGENESKPLDVDQVIGRLNVIRGGKSFANPEVYSQFAAYFKTLNETDKVIIDRFLQSINKIVIQVSANQDQGQGQGQGGVAQPPVNQSPSPGNVTLPGGSAAAPALPGVPGAV